jgi:hypothetical protein
MIDVYNITSLNVCKMSHISVLKETTSNSSIQTCQILMAFTPFPFYFICSPFQFSNTRLRGQSFVLKDSFKKAMMKAGSDLICDSCF